jgi:hypothetical protein
MKCAGETQARIAAVPVSKGSIEFSAKQEGRLMGGPRAHAA